MTGSVHAFALALCLAGGTAAKADDPPLDRILKGQPLLDDLAQFRGLLKTEWMLANLTDADFDAAIDAVAKDAPAGMTAAELAFRLQRVLALGADGHAMIGQFSSALRTVPGPRPKFLIDLAGDGYAAFSIEHDPISRVNPGQNYRFAPLRPGYPYIVAIDGVPMAKWVEAARPYVVQGTPTAQRWRAMELVRDLPVLRRDMKLPNPPGIRVKLASADRKAEVEIDAPATKDRLFPFPVPKPAESRIVDDENIGYLCVPDCFSIGYDAVVREMPKLKGTRGLILDLRDNEGGGMDLLGVVAAHLLPADKPRRAVGEAVHWQGAVVYVNSVEVTPDTKGLSAAGRGVVADFRKGFERGWQPPKGRATEARTLFLTRAEVEPDLHPYNNKQFPKTYVYAGPVVVLFNHRCFSAAEIFLDGIRKLDNVTLVGTATTAGGAGSGQWHKLKNSGLDAVLAKNAYLRADGTVIDGKGVAPDVIDEVDADCYLGGRDRMLDKAIEVLKVKIAARK